MANAVSIATLLSGIFNEVAFSIYLSTLVLSEYSVLDSFHISVLKGIAHGVERRIVGLAIQVVNIVQRVIEDFYDAMSQI